MSDKLYNNYKIEKGIPLPKKKSNRGTIKELTKGAECNLSKTIDSFNKNINKNSKVALSLRITLNSISTEAVQVSKWLKKWFDALRPFKYCAVYKLEFTASGFAHYHLLLRVWGREGGRHNTDYYRKSMLRLWERFSGGVKCPDENLKPVDNAALAKSYLLKNGQFVGKEFQTMMRGKKDNKGLGCKWWGRRNAHLFLEEVPSGDNSNRQIEKQSINVLETIIEDPFASDKQNTANPKQSRLDGQPYDDYDLNLTLRQQPS